MPGGAQPALDLIRLLASEIGPRRPCSPEERRAADSLADWLRERGVDAQLEAFEGYASFGPLYAGIFATALAGALIRRRRPLTGWALSTIAGASLVLEGDLRFRPLSKLWSRRPSVNLVATVPPAGPTERRVCLVAHLDSSRSGLLFHPRVVRQLPHLMLIPGISALALAASPALRRLPGGKALERLGIAGLLLALALVAERELRGTDVPGASDNASGCGVVAQLAAECARQPLTRTHVDVLITGCEESGVLGAEAYLRRDRARAAKTAFINFDTVGGDVPLTYILAEGGALTRPATPALVVLAERVATERPDLGLRADHRTAGLPTDVTVFLALGHDGITFLAQGETIPHYHWPTDTFENVSPAAVERALETGRAMLAAIDSTRDLSIAPARQAGSRDPDGAPATRRSRDGQGGRA